MKLKTEPANAAANNQAKKPARKKAKTATPTVS